MPTDYLALIYKKSLFNSTGHRQLDIRADFQILGPPLLSTYNDTSLTFDPVSKSSVSRLSVDVGLAVSHGVRFVRGLKTSDLALTDVDTKGEIDMFREYKEDAKVVLDSRNQNDLVCSERPLGVPFLKTLPSSTASSQYLRSCS